MEYFRSFNLDREPFSNSPDPGLFYESRQHLQALQQLEISIRLKRGLNIITGDVGTGKTTLSRQLIRKLSQDPDIRYSLVLDPGFSSRVDFLSCIYKTFVDRPDRVADEYALKEAIKNHLFLKGVDENLTLVLIIDEGQKLPVFCLEILRELLNYETNDQKLLQIVIFAQKEFDPVVDALENFKDRINFRYVLSPLGFTETKALINFRLSQSLNPGEPVRFFSFFSYFALFYYTRGYPRKIINLCHHIILSLIVEDKSSADFFFVRACAGKIFFPSGKHIGVLPFAVALIILTFSASLFNFPDISGFKNLSVFSTLSQTSSAGLPHPDITPDINNDPVSVAKADTPGSVLPAAFENNAGKPTIEDSSTTILPDTYGRLELTQNLTLSRMMEYIYGGFNDEYLRQLLAHNRQIRNPDFIRAGTSLKFPVMEKTTADFNKDSFCILLSQTKNFKKAYAQAREYDGKPFKVRIVHEYKEKDGFVFSVIVNRYFDTMEDARNFTNTDPVMMQAQTTRLASLISGNLSE